LKKKKKERKLNAFGRFFGMLYFTEKPKGGGVRHAAKGRTEKREEGHRAIPGGETSVAKWRIGDGKRRGFLDLLFALMGKPQGLLTPLGAVGQGQKGGEFSVAEKTLGKMHKSFLRKPSNPNKGTAREGKAIRREASQVCSQKVGGGRGDEDIRIATTK